MTILFKIYVNVRATENAEWKMGSGKNAGVENAGEEYASPKYRDGYAGVENAEVDDRRRKCRSGTVWYGMV